MTLPAESDIRCSLWDKGCVATAPHRPTDDYARVKGWHIHRWKGLDGADRMTALCPEHAGNMKRSTVPVSIEGEQTLF